MAARSRVSSRRVSQFEVVAGVGIFRRHLKRVGRGCSDSMPKRILRAMGTACQQICRWCTFSLIPQMSWLFLGFPHRSQEKPLKTTRSLAALHPTLDTQSGTGVLRRGGGHLSNCQGDAKIWADSSGLPRGQKMSGQGWSARPVAFCLAASLGLVAAETMALGWR